MKLDLDNVRKDLSNRYHRQYDKLMSQGRSDDALALTRKYMDLDKEIRDAIQNAYRIASACRNL